MGYQNTYYTVVRGDNLTKIARRYGTTWQQIYSWNRSTIGSNPNLIYPGQVFIVGSHWVDEGEHQQSSGNTKTTVTNTVTTSVPVPSNVGTVSNIRYGYQTENEDTAYVFWDFGRGNVDKFEVEWQYRTKDSQTWFIGSQTSTSNYQSTYSVPSFANRVAVKIKPVSKTYTVNNQQVEYWVANWSDWTAFDYKKKETVPVPPTPNVTIEKFKLELDMDNIDNKLSKVEVEIVQDDTLVYRTVTLYPHTNATSYSCAIAAGHRYKARARGYMKGDWSEWSTYCNDVGTVPTAPSAITSMKAESKTEIRISWTPTPNTTSYTIEYSTDRKYFDISTDVKSQTGIENSTFLLTGLESGHTYYARVKSVNAQGESEWSPIASCIVGSKPIAPTTWSSTSVATVGDIVYLYWVHNAEDGSTERAAQIELFYDGAVQPSETINVQNQQYNDETHKDDTKQYAINTALLKYRNLAVIQWRVRTCGITSEWGDWSSVRTLELFPKPTLAIQLLNKNKVSTRVLTEFPFYVKGIAGPATQTPTSYHISIIANQSYETTDRIGNKMIVSQGDEVFSQYYDNINLTLEIKMDPFMVDLENNIEYTLKVMVSMNSGLTAENELNFTIAWTDQLYTPSAEISVNRDNASVYIRPFCSSTTIKRKLMVLKPGTQNEYVKASQTSQNADDVVNAELLKDGFWRDVDDPYTFIHEDGTVETDNKVYGVYSGKNPQGTTKQYILYAEEESLVQDVTLSVYRREFDGSFTEIGTGLKNTRSTFVTDPHPALDYARYRIVAIHNATGAVSYTDTSAYPIQEKAIIIQWDEQWSNFDVGENETSSMVQQPWSGSLLRLPYNIDTSDKHTIDVELVSYSGRKHPVSYYGTHVGEHATWNFDIPKDDIETLYALRRLSVWLDDVYVREPSGTGYWAAINVSFSNTHNEVIIPVSLDIARVEGGM